jgi:hypothetical protein
MKLKGLLPLLMLLSIGSVMALPHTAILQTVPGIAVGSATAVIGCTVLSMSPGSIIENTAGFIVASCQQPGYAVDFHRTLSETPTFVANGWIQITLMRAGVTCGYPATFFIGGSNMTSGSPIPFSDNGSNSTLAAGGGTPYNYCLYFSNAPLTGIASFSITWT